MRIKISTVLSLAFAICTSTACVDLEGPVDAALPESQVFAELEISTDAAVMKLNDTLQLRIYGIAMDNSHLDVDTRKVQWKSGDTLKVYVDTIGRLFAKALTINPVMVTARYSMEGMTRYDTTYVQVNNSAVIAKSVKLTLLDSNRVGANGISNPRIRADLYNGDAIIIRGAQIPFTAPANVRIGYLPAGGNMGEPVYEVANVKSLLGKFWVKASVTLYGQEVRDSVEFVGIYPAGISALWIMDDEAGGMVQYTGAGHNVQVCGAMTIMGFSEQQVDIVYSDSAESDGTCAPFTDAQVGAGNYGFNYLGETTNGNISGLQMMDMAIRKSTKPGRVDWYLRDAVTKKRLNVHGHYFVIPN